MSVLRESELQNSYEAGYLDGCVEERERIIALVELNLDCEFTDYDYLGFRDHSPYCQACELVELIKGENE